LRYLCQLYCIIVIGCFDCIIIWILVQLTIFSHATLSTILTCSPNMRFLAGLVSDNAGNLKNWSLGHRPPQSSLRKQFLHGSEFLFVGTYASDLTFLAPLTSEICDFPKLGPMTQIRGHPRGSKLVIVGFYRYDILLVIKCTRGRVLHRFRDIAIDMSNVAIFGYPSCI